MTLFVAKTKQGFDFAVDNFKFPVLSSPGEQGLDGQWQAILSIAQHGIDQIKDGLAVLLLRAALPGLTTHANQE